MVRFFCCALSSRRKTGFTLVEMLIVVAITGIVITSGVAPLVYTVRLLAEAQRDFRESGAERTAVNRLFSDVREMALLHVGAPLKLIHREKLGSRGDDLLLLWTMTPRYSGLPVGSVAYGIAKDSILRFVAINSARAVVAPLGYRLIGRNEEYCCCFSYRSPIAAAQRGRLVRINPADLKQP